MLDSVREFRRLARLRAPGLRDNPFGPVRSLRPAGVIEMLPSLSTERASADIHADYVSFHEEMVRRLTLRLGFDWVDRFRIGTPEHQRQHEHNVRIRSIGWFRVYAAAFAELGLSALIPPTHSRVVLGGPDLEAHLDATDLWRSRFALACAVWFMQNIAGLTVRVTLPVEGAFAAGATTPLVEVKDDDLPGVPAAPWIHCPLVFARPSSALFIRDLTQLTSASLQARLAKCKPQVARKALAYSLHAGSDFGGRSIIVIQGATK